MANIKISELPQLIFSSITNNDVIPIVDVNSNTTSKVLIGDLKTYFTTIFTGGTIGGLTANTISATTYQNLPIDVFVTGGTYSNGVTTFTNNIGETFNVTGYFTGYTNVVNTLTTGVGLSGDTISGDITIINTSPDQVVVLTAGSNIDVTGTYPNFTIDVTGLTDNDKYVTGFSYNNNTFTIGDNSGNTFDATFNDVTGLTINGDLIVTGNTTLNGLTATTISATTYLNLPQDIFVTGATYNNNTFSYTNNSGGTFDVSFNTLTGLTVNGNLSATTIGTSTNCTSDIYVSNIHSCSPLYINKFNEGDVFIGSANTLTVDVINNRIGIKKSNPGYTLDVGGSIHTFGVGNTGIIVVEDTQPGGATIVLDPQFGTGIPQLATNGNFPIVFSTNNSERVRIKNTGEVGIGVTNPSERLEVTGKTKTTNIQITSGATNGYVLTSDSSGNGTWQQIPSFTGGTVIGTTNFTNGLTATTISATTYQGIPIEIQVACSDETTALTTGTTKTTFRSPRAFTLTEVRASLTTAQSLGTILEVDINLNGSSVLGTKLTIDNTQKTSTTATTPPTITTSSITDDGEITIDIDAIGDGTAAGLKVTLLGIR